MTPTSWYSITHICHGVPHSFLLVVEGWNITKHHHTLSPTIMELENGSLKNDTYFVSFAIGNFFLPFPWTTILLTFDFALVIQLIAELLHHLLGDCEFIPLLIGLVNPVHCLPNCATNSSSIPWGSYHCASASSFTDLEFAKGRWKKYFGGESAINHRQYVYI